MKKEWTNKWNARYSNTEFAYGIVPNRFLESQLKDLEPATILFPAEGEGRNAVYAAKEGWQVAAFDISEEGKNKALQLAETNKVSIEYNLGSLENLGYKEQQFQVIALIYAHFPAAIKSDYHKLLSSYLQKGGIVIFEAFSKKHLEYNSKNPKVGGPKDLDSLFSIEEIKLDFPDFEIISLEEKEIQLNEGLYHNGKGSVIRFIGRKK